MNFICGEIAETVKCCQFVTAVCTWA